MVPRHQKQSGNAPNLATCIHPDWDQTEARSPMAKDGIDCEDARIACKALPPAAIEPEAGSRKRGTWGDGTECPPLPDAHDHHIFKLDGWKTGLEMRPEPSKGNHWPVWPIWA